MIIFRQHTLSLLTLAFFLITAAAGYWATCWGWIPWQPFPIYCPVESEESRYPSTIDVLVTSHDAPKWRHPVAVLPSGRKLLYESRTSGELKLYDFETRTAQPVFLPERVFFQPEYITDEWALIGYDTGWNIINLETQEQMPLTTIATDTALFDGIPTEHHALIQQHPLVYIVRGNLILVPTHLGDTSATTYIIQSYLGQPQREKTEQIVAHLREMGVEPINPTSIYSSDQNFYFYPSDKTIAINPDVTPAILNAQSKEVLAESDLVHFQPIGWTAKQDGVVMIAHEYPCLYGHLACIPQPILLLRQSADHLSPEAQEQFAAKDAQEARVKKFASIVMFLLIAVSVALFGTILTIIFRRSRATSYR